jgi:hypothetical protein
MSSDQASGEGHHRGEIFSGIFEAVWPLLSVVVIVAVLAAAVGSGLKLDVLTWPAIRYAIQDCGDKPDCRVFTQMTIDYSIVSFGAAFFLFLNSLSFVHSVQKLNRHLIGQGVESSLIRDLGVNIRLFALIPTFFWLLKIALLDATDYPTTIDEWMVILTFGGCTMADLSILVVLWRQKSSSLWSENREVLGALFYIDIPTVIGVWLIARYAPMLLKDSQTPEMMLRAISGGALVIHVVTSQFILCFLIAEAKMGRFLGMHWRRSSGTHHKEDSQIEKRSSE